MKKKLQKICLENSKLIYISFNYFQHDYAIKKYTKVDIM